MAADDAPRLTVVFVDDEPNVLDGLRRTTRRFRTTWDTHFADSGPAALEVIAGLPRVDVLVTDMRMPGMDGAELLSHVRDRWPTVARIILSGQSDHDAVFRAIGPAHQYLAKPCDVDALAAVIGRLDAGSCPAVVDPVRTLIGRVDRLPALPEQYQRLTEQLGSPTARLADIAAVIADDIALTAEVLRVVNSAFFGLYGTVHSVESAVSLLGIDVVRGIVLGSKLFDVPGGRSGWLDLRALGTRSRSVASAARGTALRLGAEHTAAAAAFLAGMVSEIGLLVMAQIETGSDFAGEINRGGAVDLDDERRHFGGDRFQVGAHLLGLWGFDEVVVQAVCGLGALRCGDDPLSRAVCAARRLVFDAGVDPVALADPREPIPAVDAVLAAPSSPGCAATSADQDAGVAP